VATHQHCVEGVGCGLELDIGAGWMDYLACAYGGVNAINSSTPPRITRIADTLGAPLVLVDTLERRSTRSVLAAKRAQLTSRDPAMLSYVARTTELATAMTRELTWGTEEVENESHRCPRHDAVANLPSPRPSSTTCRRA
jgi:galactokinase/mevalonate kinase-like predicted kinase